MAETDDGISGVEAYTALKESRNNFYSIFFQADGYHPPTIVRLLVLGTYGSLFSLFGIALLAGIDHFFFESTLLNLLPVQAVRDLTGYSNITGGILFGLIVLALFLSTYVCGILASKISLPYEETHIDWAEEILPNRDSDEYYPPYEYWADKVIDEEYLTEEAIPSTAPPELRELTMYERVVQMLWSGIGRILHMFYLVMTMQMVVFFNNMGGSETGPFRNR